MARREQRVGPWWLLLAGCASTTPAPQGPLPSRTRAPSPTEEASGSRPRPDEPDPAPPTPPEAEPAPEEPATFAALPVAGFLDAVISLPGGKRAPQPVLFATHGAGGTPEHHCQAWRRQLGKRGIVVCPRGALINRSMGPDAGFYYPNHHELEAEVVATLEAVDSQLGERIDQGAFVYAGYSQGATMGALMLPAHGDRFPLVVLVEGGGHEWDLRAARRFATGGGKRLLFVCGVRACHGGALESSHLLRRAGIEVQVRHAPAAGHTYLGRVADEIGAGLSWLFESDARWTAPMSGHHLPSSGRAYDHATGTPWNTAMATGAVVP